MKLPSIEKLSEMFSRFPSVGKKSAERMAHALLAMDEEDVQDMAKAMLDAKANISKCPRCGLYKEGDTCPYCDDPSRDTSSILVVTSYKDAEAIEDSGSYKGLYHCLGGVLAPSKGVYPEDLNVVALINRLREGNVKEVILATNPNLEGETTALYVARLLEEEFGDGINVSRLAYGLSMGSSLEYSDSLTLQKALEGRKKI